MKIAVWANQATHSQEIKEELLKRCANIVQIDDKEPDIVISIGGDGTLLSAFHHYNTLNKPTFVAIHTGHLGFYTDFLANQLQELVDYLVSAKQNTYSYPLLDITLVNEQKTMTALNELTLKTTSGTLVCQVYIGEELFEVFRGDGLCVSTPTGSTGVSKSLGGAVVHPKVEAMQLVEIAALNNVVYRTIGSPLILPKDETVRLKVIHAQDPIITYDNVRPIHLGGKNNAIVEIKLSKERIHFADYKHIDFWSRVEGAFIGDIKGKKK
ncbi:MULTISPECIES: NAD kinase [unclassified Granulicatella]|uniref:NAD kinase n=1 Tax=unclassified Granulicatella TaxID=2630493 RepID=UPI0010730180|nr:MULTISPECIES: NAD kinase [unclassified Granulicatella]MBF0779605.1 NAD kinase [Granulicatella sp. 19428wC4_WM01]TFU96404.1 NAD kinase [Granulicatella sp. WM01]